jgi:hypothetical protein
VRVFVPVTVAMLGALVAEGELWVAGGTAFALTPALREAYASGDEEELSYVAMSEAARASLRLLAAELDGAEPGAVVVRRVVLSADVDEVTLRPDLDDAVVRLRGPLTLADVASAHVDLVGAEDAVRAAVSAVDEADMGDLAEQELRVEVADHELAWYDAQELGFLVELL